MLKAVKIKSELMKDIEGYLETRGDFESRSDFVNKAIEEQLKTLAKEETDNAIADIRREYSNNPDIHEAYGVTSFKEYLDKVMKSSGQAKEIKEIRKEVSRIKDQSQNTGKRLTAKVDEIMKEVQRKIQKLKELQDETKKSSS